MTRRDYVLISKVLRESHHLLTQSEHYELCADFAEALEKENSRFDIVRFMRECGAAR